MSFLNPFFLLGLAALAAPVLVLRCLAMLLVVFAFTRPYFTTAGAAKESEGTRATVILIDGSLSMRRAGLFEEARRRADALVGEMPADERVALLSFGEGYEVVSGFTADKNALRAALGGLRVGYEATDYEQALRGAEALFRETKAGGARRV